MKTIYLMLLLINCSSKNCSLETAKRHLNKKEIKEAMYCYKELFSTSDSTKAYNDLGDYYWKESQMDSSIKYYQRLIFSKNAPLYTIINLGDSYYKSGDYLKALNCFLMVERRDSVFPLVNYNISIIYFLNFELYDKALKFALKEYQTDSQNIDNLNLIGQLYLNMDDTQKSIEYFTNSIRLNSNYYLTYYLRALAYAYKEDYTLAQIDLIKCLSINPEFVDGLIEKIKVNYHLNNDVLCDDIFQLKTITTEVPQDIINIENKICR